jgi:hypothetical protein
MQDESQTTAVQPVTTESYDVPVKNAMGAQEVYAGLTALFPLDQVLALRAKGEFYIVVVGTQGEKRYKVKTKHFAQLPLMPFMSPEQPRGQQRDMAHCERPPGGIWPRKKGVKYCS